MKKKDITPFLFDSRLALDLLERIANETKNVAALCAIGNLRRDYQLSGFYSLENVELLSLALTSSFQCCEDLYRDCCLKMGNLLKMCVDNRKVIIPMSPSLGEHNLKRKLFEVIDGKESDPLVSSILMIGYCFILIVDRKPESTTLSNYDKIDANGFQNDETCSMIENIRHAFAHSDVSIFEHSVLMENKMGGKEAFVKPKDFVTQSVKTIRAILSIEKYDDDVKQLLNVIVENIESNLEGGPCITMDSITVALMIFIISIEETLGNMDTTIQCLVDVEDFEGLDVKFDSTRYIGIDVYFLRICFAHAKFRIRGSYVVTEERSKENIIIRKFDIKELVRIANMAQIVYIVPQAINALTAIQANVAENYLFSQHCYEKWDRLVQHPFYAHSESTVSDG